MVINRNQRSRKQMHTNSKKRGHGRRHFSKRNDIQNGGVSPSCVLQSATTNMMGCNPAANLHNINPQASLDLDNKFMSYGGAVPLGNNILQGGASSKCGDEGVGTGYGKSETFKQYLDGLTNQYNLVGGQPDNGFHEPNEPYENNTPENEVLVNNVPVPNVINQGNIQPANEESDNGSVPNVINEGIETIQQPPQFKPLNGGGFTTDPSEYIAGLPVYKAYDDCCPPALVGGKLQFGAPDQPVCGLGAIKGGNRHRKSKSKRNSKNSKKHKKQYKSKKNRKTNTRMHRGGGDWVRATRSNPAPFSEAFNGPAGVFQYPDDMTKRTFDEYQPNYTPNAI